MCIMEIFDPFVPPFWWMGITRATRRDLVVKFKEEPKETKSISCLLKTDHRKKISHHPKLVKHGNQE